MTDTQVPDFFWNIQSRVYRKKYIVGRELKVRKYHLKKILTQFSNTRLVLPFFSRLTSFSYDTEKKYKILVQNTLYLRLEVIIDTLLKKN